MGSGEGQLGQCQGAGCSSRTSEVLGGSTQMARSGQRAAAVESLEMGG